MEFEIITSKNNHKEIANRIAGFFQSRGIKDREQLCFRFDAIMTEYAMLNNGLYDAQNKTITLN